MPFSEEQVGSFLASVISGIAKKLEKVAVGYILIGLDYWSGMVTPRSMGEAGSQIIPAGSMVPIELRRPLSSIPDHGSARKGT